MSLYHDVSTAPLLDLRRKLKLVVDLLSAMIRDGVSLAQSVELALQWDAIFRVGLVLGLHRRLSDFIHAVVVRRREVAIRGWRKVA